MIPVNAIRRLRMCAVFIIPWVVFSAFDSAPNAFGTANSGRMGQEAEAACIESQENHPGIQTQENIIKRNRLHKIRQKNPTDWEVISAVILFCILILAALSLVTSMIAFITALITGPPFWALALITFLFAVAVFLFFAISLHDIFFRVR